MYKPPVSNHLFRLHPILALCLTLAALAVMGCTLALAPQVERMDFDLRFLVTGTEAAAKDSLVPGSRLLLPTATSLTVSLIPVSAELESPEPKTVALVAGDDSATVSFTDIAIGAYTIKAEAASADGTVLFRQTSPIDIEAGSLRNLTLHLLPVAPGGAFDSLALASASSLILEAGASVTRLIPEGSLVGASFRLCVEPSTTALPGLLVFAQDASGALLNEDNSASVLECRVAGSGDSARTYITIYNPATTVQEFILYLNISYTVAFDSKGGDAIPSQTIPRGNEAAIPVEPTKTGSTFAGWYIDNECLTPWVFSTPVYNDITLFAKWSLSNYTVSFDSQGGSAVEALASVYYGNTIVAPTPPTRTGYTFGGWYREATCATAWDFASNTVTSTIILYAKWTANGYTLSFDPQSGTVTPASMEVTYDSLVGTLPTPARTGYSFTGWFTEPGGTGLLYTESTIYETTGNTTLYAYWTNQGYYLLFDTQGGDPVTLPQMSVTYDTAVGILPSPTRTGYAFGGWYSGANGTGELYIDTTVYKQAGNTTLYAKWAANPYTISFDAQGGTVAPTTLAVTYDAAIGTMPAPSRTGYTFAGWYTEFDSLCTPTTVYAVASDSTLHAHWTANGYTLALDPQGGAVTPTSLSITYDEAIGTLPVPTRLGFTFMGWYASTAGSGAHFTETSIYTLASDSTLYAYWLNTGSLTISLLNPTDPTVVFSGYTSGVPFLNRKNGDSLAVSLTGGTYSYYYWTISGSGTAPVLSGETTSAVTIMSVAGSTNLATFRVTVLFGNGTAEYSKSFTITVIEE